jgi:putative phage-type endonuclease
MSASLHVIDPADRLGWLRWRRGGLGASDAAAVCGLSRWDSPYSLWLDKTGQLPLTGDENPEQRWGKLLEPAICEAFEQDTGLTVSDRQALVVHPERPWQRATLDGRVNDVGRPLYEGKSSNGWTWKDGIPRAYMLQVQHQLAADDAPGAYLAALIDGGDFQIHEVDRDERVIRILTALEHDFWHDHVLKRLPPTVDGSERTARAIKEAFPAPTRTRVDLPREAVALARQYHQGKSLERSGKKSAAEAQNRLTALLGDAEEGWVGDEQIVRWPLVSAHRLDEKALRIAHPDVAAEFTKPTTYRRIWVVGTKEES